MDFTPGVTSSHGEMGDVAAFEDTHCVTGVRMMMERS